VILCWPCWALWPPGSSCQVCSPSSRTITCWVVSLRAGRRPCRHRTACAPRASCFFFHPVPECPRGASSSVVPPLTRCSRAFLACVADRPLLPQPPAWLVTIALVRAAAACRPRSRRRGSGRCLCLAGFSLEYAVGVWPHALAACLSLAAFVAALTRPEGSTPWAYAAGLLAGLAAGVRYQHIVTAGLNRARSAGRSGATGA